MNRLLDRASPLAAARREPSRATGTFTEIVKQPGGRIDGLTGVEGAGTHLPGPLAGRARTELDRIAGDAGAGGGDGWTVTQKQVTELAVLGASLLLVLLRHAGATETEALPPDHPCREKERTMDHWRDQCLALNDAYAECRSGEGPTTPTGPGGDPGDPKETETGETDGEDAPGGSEEDCEGIWSAYQEAGANWLEAAESFNSCMKTA